MNIIFLVLGFASFLPAAIADSINSSEFECRELKHFVEEQGKVVIYSSADRYNLYVRDGSFCLRDEIAVPAWIPTRDVSQCPVGFVCRSSTQEGR